MAGLLKMDEHKCRPETSAMRQPHGGSVKAEAIIIIIMIIIITTTTTVKREVIVVLVKEEFYTFTH